MKIRLLTVLVLLVLVFAGWSMLSENETKKANDYNSYLAAARENVRVGLPAETAYNAALAIKDSPELRIEIIEYYLSQGGIKKAEKALTSFLEKYPKNPLAYEYCCNYYAENDNYTSVYIYASEMRNRGVSSEKVTKLCQELRYKYYTGSNKYYKVDPFCAGVARFYTENGKIGYLTISGGIQVQADYNVAAPYTGTESMLVTDTNEQSYYISYSGEKCAVDTQLRGMVFEEIQGFSDGLIAVKEKGKYRYIDYSFNTVNEEKQYLYAGTFNCGVAAVQTEAGWQLIDLKQNAINGAVYEEILVDENGIASRQNVVFVKENGRWYLTGVDGTRISDQAYEDAHIPAASAGDIAVKLNGKWGYISSNGNSVFDFTYEDARSFSNGFAAVCVDGKWGFINTENEIVIEAIYDGAMDFGYAGSVAVKKGKTWVFITLYSSGYTF